MLSLSEVIVFLLYLKFTELKSKMKQSTQFSFFVCAGLLKVVNVQQQLLKVNRNAGKGKEEG